MGLIIRWATHEKTDSGYYQPVVIPVLFFIFRKDEHKVAEVMINPYFINIFGI